MNQLKPTREQLLHGLREAGLRDGDTVYVASSLAALGLMADPVRDALWALREAVGAHGTLVMPAFNFGFCEGQAFDREHTSSRAGVLSEAFRQMTGARRTWSPPFHTVAASGARAEEIASKESLTAFGRDSVFQHLHDIGAKHLLLGCGYHEGVAQFHWLEETHEVPYRHWKRFEGEVVLGGARRWRTFFMFARNPDCKLDAEPLGREFEAAGHVRQAEVGLCRLRAFGLREFHEFMGPRFARNPRALLAAGPRPSVEDRPSPVKRIDHIGIVSRYSDRMRDFFQTLPLSLSGEGVISEIGVNCQYFDGLNVTLELVDPVREDSRVSAHARRNSGCPLHHIAFEVDDMEGAVTFFKTRGYEPMDGNHYFGPKRHQRVLFLSPVQTGGLLVELVCNDGEEFQIYGGAK